MPKGKVKTRTSKHDTRPWHFRLRVESDEGRALEALGSLPMRFREEGAWVEHPAGPQVVERVAERFWRYWKKADGQLKPTAEKSGPVLALGWRDRILADKEKAMKRGIWWAKEGAGGVKET